MGIGHTIGHRLRASLRRALEAAGVELIPAKNGKGVGVKIKVLG